MQNDIEWRRCITLPELEVAENGQLRTVIKGKLKLLKSRNNGNGYWNVNRRNRTFYVHRLVAEVFLGAGPQPDLEVNHIDGNKANNHWSNLEWVTHETNMAHAIRTGLKPRTFTIDEEKAIWFMKDCGMTIVDIAKAFNKTCRQPIYTVLQGARV